MYDYEAEIKRIYQKEIDRPIQFDMNFEKAINNVFNKKYRRTRVIKSKIISIISAIALLLAGVAIATNFNAIETHFRWLGKGVETAIENGYIATPNKEFVAINDVGTNVVIEDFLMDDMNLSASFAFKFTDSLKDKVDLDNVRFIEINNLFIRDEENRIIYGGLDKETFDNYCDKYNLDYTFRDFNDNYKDNGINYFVESKEDNFIRLICNMNSDMFPKSKKLYLSFNKIVLLKDEDNKQTEYDINGDWNVEVSVPESMYNRSKEYYKVVSCSDPNFEVYAASVSDTGFELGVIISNIEKPEFDEDIIIDYSRIIKQYNEGKISENEYNNGFGEYTNFMKSNNPICVDKSYSNNTKENVSYIENLNGEKYNSNLLSNKNKIKKFMDNQKYNFYEIFSMTKYNTSNRIKAVLYYYDKPVIIELEKI